MDSKADRGGRSNALYHYTRRSERHNGSTQRPPVVTGRDKDGNAVIKIDEVGKVRKKPRPGAEYVELWSTRDGFPIGNKGGI